MKNAINEKKSIIRGLDKEIGSLKSRLQAAENNIKVQIEDMENYKHNDSLNEKDKELLALCYHGKSSDSTGGDSNGEESQSVQGSESRLHTNNVKNSHILESKAPGDSN